jgi:hypothetical protein
MAKQILTSTSFQIYNRNRFVSGSELFDPSRTQAYEKMSDFECRTLYSELSAVLRIWIRRIRIYFSLPDSDPYPTILLKNFTVLNRQTSFLKEVFVPGTGYYL